MIQHATQVGNKRLWMDPEVEEFTKILNHGHPALGWDGDPQLGLFRLPDKRWQIMRLEGGRYVPVCTSKPGAKLDWSVIIRLMDHDLHRRTAQSLLDAVDKHNAKVQKDIDDKATDTIGNSVERLYWGIKKDLKGTIYQ